MTDEAWQGDACSLVEEFRARRRSPTEEVQAVLAAIRASSLNCMAHVDPERALAAARDADVSLPLGGLPVAIKQLDPVEGWPYTHGSLALADVTADHSSTMVRRLTGDGGAVPVAQTTASEFGGLNISVNRLNGVTHNPWRRGRTAGGSSGGSAAAVAGGLLTLATGGDGAGSIRIPAGYTGLFGLKGTFGRIPRGPHAPMRPHTIVLGCLTRSVRDTARFYDVCAGYDHHDPTSLPRQDGWEARLGTRDLRGRTVIVAPSLAGVLLAPGVAERIEEAAGALIAELGLRRVEAPLELPRLAAQWMMGNAATLLALLGDRWPGCAPLLTDEVRAAVYLAQSLYNLHVAAASERERVRANDVMAAAFSAADIIICATNPDPAFAADAPLSSEMSGLVQWARTSRLVARAMPAAMAATRAAAGVHPRLPTALLEWSGRRFTDLVDMGALTMASNLHGSPAASVPVGHVDGLPVGMQILAAHHREPLLLDLALHVERERPWPLVAPGAPL